MENRKKCIRCGALLPQEASFCPCCTASQLAREPMSPPRSEKRRGALACAVLLVVLMGAVLWATLGGRAAQTPPRTDGAQALEPADPTEPTGLSGNYQSDGCQTWYDGADGRMYHLYVCFSPQSDGGGLPASHRSELLPADASGTSPLCLFVEDAEDPNSANDFGKNIIPKMLKNGEKMAAYRFSGYWKDVGTLDSLWDANMDMLATGSGLDLLEKDWPIYGRSVSAPPAYLGVNAHVEHSVVARGCTVEGEAENSVLSERCTVEEGASVQYSILMPGAVVKKDARVFYAIIGENGVVGEHAFVGAPPEAVPPEQWGITVLGPGAAVADDYVLPANRMRSVDGKETVR